MQTQHPNTSNDTYNDIYETLLSSCRKLAAFRVADPAAYERAYRECEKEFDEKMEQEKGGQSCVP